MMNSDCNISVTYLNGHESFYLREGWLKKSLDVIAENPTIFQNKNLLEAINQLGVGANMVKSMRYWLELCGLIEHPEKGDKHSLTDIANIIRSNDPYFQHRDTLWVLHSIVASQSPLWRFIFVENELPVFDKDFASEMAASRLKELGKKFATKSLSDSVSVFLNTYAANHSTADPENNIQSPFSKLRLIIRYGHDKYAFRTISDTEYSPYLVYFLFLMRNNRQISQGDVFAKMKGVMNIELNSLRKSLDYLEHEGVIHIDRTAGLNNITKKDVKYLSPERIFKRMMKATLLS